MTKEDLEKENEVLRKQVEFLKERLNFCNKELENENNLTRKILGFKLHF